MSASSSRTTASTSTSTSAGASARTAVVTGASRGLGRAVAAELVARDFQVLGLARGEADLLAVRAELGERFVPLVGDATDEALAESVLREHRPTLLVLGAGAHPLVAPVQEQSWESFSENWQTDTRHVFTWITEVLRRPPAPGSVVVSLSSGAVLGGSPLSGGYASAKAAVRYLSQYAAEEAQRAGLDLRFVTVLPQMTPGTGIGTIAIEGYAARAGVDQAAFVAARGPILTPAQFAKALVEVALDPQAAAEYRGTGDGLLPLG
ncbi:short-chain dehydrogenase [Streptomyces tateyamensis]|uniref:Short-chain dehydrogenase n=1 Tax=Streptomyces tateyamensis TaxID=565073 RepID=A0A2V4NJ98_9ACTN|nr:SDR family oxidoreductase [Streptomyces tateyamensis]PYC80555.1 short-chain dehydrogenase [Streptomyces tateyamensis]